ncbi:hypothetical protein ACVWWI_006523 [Bradyrhizobium sp. USDA 3686]|nr:hypothetical protein [Bradyrhizobium canariense]
MSHFVRRWTTDDIQKLQAMAGSIPVKRLPLNWNEAHQLLL